MGWITLKISYMGSFAKYPKSTAKLFFERIGQVWALLIIWPIGLENGQIRAFGVDLPLLTMQLRVKLFFEVWL